jgi:beta-glucosidase-like glycosyl hydrolase
VDPFKGASTAQRVAEQSSVLLKNANSLLPLDAARVKSIAIIGSKAERNDLQFQNGATTRSLAGARWTALPFLTSRSHSDSKAFPRLRVRCSLARR